jgi:hypothetical protein
LSFGWGRVPIEEDQTRIYTRAMDARPALSLQDVRYASATTGTALTVNQKAIRAVRHV